MYSRKNRKNLKGGNAGSGWSPYGQLSPSVNWIAENKVYDSCLTVPRPGQIAFQNTGGLPGMKGGAYTNNLFAPTIAGLPQIDKIACTPNYVNPLNHQKGGVGLLGASDMGVYEAPTARYTQSPSQWTNSVGAPLLLNQPMDAKLISKACVQTAGKRRNVYKKSRKSKKSRKTKKNRKVCMRS
jgi:hypothetical protein